jgi:hypothetical protein
MQPGVFSATRATRPIWREKQFWPTLAASVGLGGFHAASNNIDELRNRRGFARRGEHAWRHPHGCGDDAFRRYDDRRNVSLTDDASGAGRWRRRNDREGT